MDLPRSILILICYFQASYAHQETFTGAETDHRQLLRRIQLAYRHAQQTTGFVALI